MRKEKTYTVHEVMVDGKGEGPAGDGTFILRFKRQGDAKATAAKSTCYGRPAKVSTVTDVPQRLAMRWGVA